MKPQLLNVLGKNEETLSSSGGASSGPFAPFYATSERAGNPYVVPAIISRWRRDINSPASDWTSTGYWTTMYGYYQSGNDAIQRYGFARPHGAQKGQYSSNSFGMSDHRLVYAKNKTVGQVGQYTVGGGSSQSYNPIFTCLMYIKNTNSSNTTVYIYGSGSANWSSGHDGSSCMWFNPNSATKSNVTGGSFNSLWSSSGSSSILDFNSSFTLDAGKTAAVVLFCTARYHTTFSSGWHGSGAAMFRSLDTTFGTTGIVPDYNMYATVMMATSPQVDSNYLTSTTEIAGDWKRCHDIFGD